MSQQKKGMATRIQNCMRYLELVTEAGNVSQLFARQLLVKATPEQAQCIIEVIINTLAGNIPLSEDDRISLNSKRRTLIKLAEYTGKEEAQAGIVKHYNNVVTFLYHCVPSLRDMLSDGDSDDEIQ